MYFFTYTYFFKNTNNIIKITLPNSILIFRKDIEQQLFHLVSKEPSTQFHTSITSPELIGRNYYSLFPLAWHFCLKKTKVLVYSLHGHTTYTYVWTIDYELLSACIFALSVPYRTGTIKLCKIAAIERQVISFPRPRSHAVSTERTILSPFTKEYRVHAANSGIRLFLEELFLWESS